MGGNEPSSLSLDFDSLTENFEKFIDVAGSTALQDIFLKMSINAFYSK